MIDKIIAAIDVCKRNKGGGDKEYVITCVY